MMAKYRAYYPGPDGGEDEIKILELNDFQYEQFLIGVEHPNARVKKIELIEPEPEDS